METGLGKLFWEENTHVGIVYRRCRKEILRVQTLSALKRLMALGEHGAALPVMGSSFMGGKIVAIKKAFRIWESDRRLYR